MVRKSLGLAQSPNMITDSPNPHPGLFSLLPSGETPCSYRTRPARFCNTLITLILFYSIRFFGFHLLCDASSSLSHLHLRSHWKRNARGFGCKLKQFQAFRPVSICLFDTFSFHVLPKWVEERNSGLKWLKEFLLFDMWQQYWPLWSVFYCFIVLYLNIYTSV